MTTYIVDVDSSYRDVNKYQTQTNFAVSFQQNTSTSSSQLLGVPYTFSDTSKNFFNFSSIDPNFNNSNLKIINGNIQEITHNDMEFYVSGIAFDTTTISTSSSPFQLLYNQTQLISLTGINNMSPYLIKVTKQVDNSYQFNWCIFAIGSVVSNDLFTSYASSITCKHIYTSRNAIFWYWDANFNSFNIFRTDVNTYAPSFLFSLTNSVCPNNMTNSFYNFITAFDMNGDDYIINNRPWGYHFVQSDFSMGSLTDQGTFQLVNDSADNLYLASNIKGTNLQFYTFSAAGLVQGNSSTFLFCSTYAYRYVTGTTGGSTGVGTLTEYFIYNRSNTEGSSELDLWILQSLPNQLNQGVVSVRLNLPSCPCKQNYFTEVDGKLYFILYTGDTSSFNISNVYPGYVTRIDPISNSITTLATTPSLFNNCNMLGSTVGSMIYFPGRSNFQTIYMYGFNTITNTISTSTSFSYSTGSSLFACVSSYQLNNDTLVVCSPDCDIRSSLNYYQRSLPLRVLTYTISTNTLTGTNSALRIYPTTSSILQKWLSYKDNRVLYFLYYNSTSVLDIFDVTTPTNPILLNSLSLQIRNYHPYSKVNSHGVTNYYLNVQQSNYRLSVYLLNDIDNIYDISTSIGFLTQYEQNIIPPSTESWSCIISPYGYSYLYSGSSTIGFQGTLSKIRWIDQSSLTLYSSHVYHNNSSLRSVSNGNTVLYSIQIRGDNYILISSPSAFQVWNASSRFTISLGFTNSISPSLSSTPLFIDMIYDSVNEVVYLLIGTLTEIYVYQLNNTLTQATLLTSIIPASGFSIRGCSFYGSGLFGIYFIVSQDNGFLRKYSITGSTVSLLTSATSTPPVGSIVFVTEAFLNTVTQKYNLFLVTQYLNASTFGQYTIFDIDSPLSITVIPGYVFNSVGTLNTTATKTWYKSVNNSGKISLYPFVHIVGNTRANPIFNLSGLNFGSDTTTVGPTSNINVTPTPLSTTNFIFNQNTVWNDSLSQKQYVAYNSNGFTGTNDRITIVNVTNPVNIINQVGTLSITVPGRVYFLDNIQLGLLTYLTALVFNPTSSTTSLWLYDVSNVENASSYQTTTFKTTSYSGLPFFGGGGILHNISAFGEPLWLNAIGGTIQDSSAPVRVSLNAIDIDSTSNLYIGGDWSRKVEFFYSSATGGSYSLFSYPSNQFLKSSSVSQAMVARCRITDGEWIWASPIIGSSDQYLTSLSYSMTTESVIYSLFFNSFQANLFSAQTSIATPTGPFDQNRYALLPQAFFYNSASTNSVILCQDSNGLFSWRIVLFSNEDINSKINVYNVFIDKESATPSFFVCGVSNSSNLIGLDSSDQLIQSLLPKINTITQNAGLLYQFGITGTYVSSSYQAIPPNSQGFVNIVRSFSSIDTIFTINQVNPFNSTGPLDIYHQDSTLASSNTLLPNTFNNLIVQYNYDPIYLDSNGFNYSTLYVYNFTGPLYLLTGSYVRSSVFVMGTPEDTILNQNFSIRSSSFDTSSSIFKIILNQKIAINSIQRNPYSVNNITGSSNYYLSNISPSPLYDIVYYSTGSISGNSLTFSYFLSHPPGTIDLSSPYYFIFPQIPTGSSTGFYTSIIPINSITYNTSTELYTASVTNINDLRINSSTGSFYGPYIYFCKQNVSAFYTLQWYPGSRIYPQTYLVGLYDLIIPNRPIQNSRYQGFQSITKYPYVYLVIYNSNDEDNFDSTVVNSVYDNNINVPRFAVFQIPTTTFTTFNNSDYMSATSSATPRIRFVPGFYNLSFRLTDDEGNTILFDSTPYRVTDNFEVVPDKLLNMTVRMAFKRS